MAIAHLIVISAWLAAAVAVNVPSCRCTNHTRPPSASSLPPPDPCNGVRCQHGGTCEADGDTFICLCAAGYEGQFCQDGIRLTSCDGVNCNRGQCEENAGEARCVCQDRATGVFCENDLCLSVNCGFNQPDPITNFVPECAVRQTVEEGQDPFDCSCEEVYDGRFCVQIFCEGLGFGLACNVNGDCIDGDRETNLPADQCICDEGFFGDHCPYGPCSDDICQNGGSCAYENHQFHYCRCRDGFEGNSCEIVTCFGNSCLNGGTCEVEGNDFTCICAEGFSGEFCEIDLSICFGVTCLNGGTCIGTSEYDAECRCQNGFSGDRCQFGPCTGQPQSFCQNGGSCLVDRKKDLLACECAEGFSGVMCEIGPCPYDVVCKNGGVCIIVNGEFLFCRCPFRVVGDRCEFAPCSEDSCQNDGSCYPVDSNPETFRCSCTRPFQGEFCEMNPCEGVQCQNGGFCDSTEESFFCSACPDEYQGQFCQDARVLASCVGVSCNRGECEEDGGVVRCVCRNGGTGLFCENDLCLSVRCAGNFRDPVTNEVAECTVLDYVEEGEDPFVCSCPESLPYGRFCDQPVCETFEPACSGNGFCIEGERETASLSDVCDCDDGFFGEMCVFGPCSDERCQNGGSCVYGDRQFQACRCQDGFEGDSCEIATCFGNSCENGGTCEVEGATFKCSCATGFAGEFCEKDLSICFGVKCLNGGLCIGTSENDAVCQCVRGYSGDRCQFGGCLSGQFEFCQNGGSCLVDRDNNRLLGCECAEGFSGAMCEVGPCPDDVVCENGGVCVIVNGDFNRCRCPQGVTGDLCEFA